MARKPRAETPAEKVSRGLRAQRELEQTEAAFEVVRTALLEAIANTKLGEVEARERLYLSVNLLPQVRDVLVAVAANAPIAEHEQAIQRIING